MVHSTAYSAAIAALAAFHKSVAVLNLSTNNLVAVSGAFPSRRTTCRRFAIPGGERLVERLIDGEFLQISVAQDWRRHDDFLQSLPELLARDAPFCTGSNDINFSGWFSRLTNGCAGMRCLLSPTADVPSHSSGAAMCHNRL